VGVTERDGCRTGAFICEFAAQNRPAADFVIVHGLLQTIPSNTHLRLFPALAIANMGVCCFPHVRGPNRTSLPASHSVDKASPRANQPPLSHRVRWGCKIKRPSKCCDGGCVPARVRLQGRRGQDGGVMLGIDVRDGPARKRNNREVPQTRTRRS
jgi:hypothetical protein